ncbi:MAG: PINc domain-containing protein [Deltaproteobacteria bacterium]|jgi:predicted nucleic acid-binding protein|nr:PINc domain-containing protein [Deltaproteobacteria bacterium]
MPAKYIFDTNIYIHCLQDRDYALRHADQYFRFLPSTYFSSVVAQELLVGCTDDLAVRRVQNFLLPFERVRRIVNPSYEDWKNAALIVVKIALRRPDLKSKKIALINDALIALSCRDIGATLVTLNLEDFELIRGLVRFRFRAF